MREPLLRQRLCVLYTVPKYITAIGGGQGRGYISKAFSFSAGSARPKRLPAMKSAVEIASVGTIALVPAMLIFVSVKKKYAAAPPAIESRAPVEFARFQ